jgi:hypothetical protein
MRTTFLVLVLMAAFGSGAAVAGPVTITGSVSDMDGEPVAGVDVATIWLEGKPAGGVKTGEDGTFELEAQSYGRPIALMVMDAERKRGAVAVVKNTAEPINVFLSTLVEVRGTFTCDDLGEKPGWTNAYVNLLPLGLHAARFSSDDAAFSFLLPTGRFQLYMYGTDVQGARRTIDVSSSKGTEMDLGAIDLKATPIAKLYGKELPPWNVTDARGVEKDVKLSDYKGKWVLLEFWFST